MYLTPGEVHGLIETCAERIGSGELVFDAVSRRLSERSMRGAIGGPGGYTPPPWTWGIDADDRRFIRRLPNVSALETLRIPRGRGPLFGVVLPALGRIPRMRVALLSIMRVKLGE
jgi:hypothetical protein